MGSIPKPVNGHHCVDLWPARTESEKQNEGKVVLVSLVTAVDITKNAQPQKSYSFYSTLWWHEMRPPKFTIQKIFRSVKNASTFGVPFVYTDCVMQWHFSEDDIFHKKSSQKCFKHCAKKNQLFSYVDKYLHAVG